MPGFGLAFAFVIKYSQTKNHHHFHHLSSSPIIIFEESHHLFNRRVKVSYFSMVSSSFAGFCNAFDFASNFQRESLFESWYGIFVKTKYACFMLVSVLIFIFLLILTYSRHRRFFASECHCQLNSHFSLVCLSVYRNYASDIQCLAWI